MKASSKVIYLAIKAFQAHEQYCFPTYICCVSRWDPDNSLVPMNGFDIKMLVMNSSYLPN